MFFLTAQALVIGVFGGFNPVYIQVEFIGTAEQVILAGRTIAFFLPGQGYCIRQVRDQGGTMDPQLVEGTGLDQGFQGPLVDLFHIKRTAKIKQVTELALFLSRQAYFFDRPLANALDRPEAVYDRVLRCGPE